MADPLEWGVSGDDGATVVYVGYRKEALRSFRDLGGYATGCRLYARPLHSGPQGAAPQPRDPSWTEVLVSRRAEAVPVEVPDA